MSDATEDQADAPGPGNAVVRRAHRRFKRCQTRESTARTRWVMDHKFANGDEYNNYQWPEGMVADRAGRPSLTVNETQQHNLHIINEAKQNKAQVKYRPTGGGASAQAAEVLEGIYRHIENISNAQMSQGVAIEFQVQAGLGFTVIRSDFVDTDSFNQEIYIRSVSNPMAVMLDCDSVEFDGSDARYGFVFADKPRDEMEERYPELKGRSVANNAVDGDDGGWMREDHIREAEYYEVSEEGDELLADASGTTIYRSEAPAELIKAWDAQAEADGAKLKRRRVVRKRVKCYTIVGDIIVDETDVPGTSVPIIPWVGTVTVIDGELDRKGHTRTMLSAQRMENYNWSAGVEFGALQSKTPYVGPMKAFEGFETYWNTANTKNHAYLPYNHVDDEGNPIPAPTRQPPPNAATAFMEGVQLARQFMASASGQFEAEMGAPGNERSGKAINERQRQGDRATYHFIDNQALAIRRQGQIILEWIPVIYDTERVMRIIGEDGTEDHVQIDPNAGTAHQAVPQNADDVSAIFNPNVGKYEVVSDVGPDYATQRQEAFNAIVQILTQAPGLIDRIGDLLFKTADFPLADQIAERLKPGLPPEAQAAIEALQKQLQNQNRLLGEAMQSLTEERLKVKAKAADTEVDAFRADTERAGMLIDNATKVDPEAAMKMIRIMAAEAVKQALQDNLGPVRLAADPTLDTEASGGDLPGATGAIPANGVPPTLVPDLGQQAATPGGM